MSSNAALPHMVLVSDEFMRINNQLRIIYHLPVGVKEAWESKADELLKQITHILDQPMVDSLSIIDMGKNELPVGWVHPSRDIRHTYIIGHRNTYGSMPYSEFNYTKIQSRLACWNCLDQWKQKYLRYKSGNLSWEMRHSNDFGFISGNSSKYSGACHIAINVLDYALHLPKEAGGFTCNKSGNPNHPVESGLILSIEGDGAHTWEKIWLFKDILPGYNSIKRYAKPVSEILFNSSSQTLSTTFTRLNSYISESDMPRISKSNIQDTFSQVFKSRDYVIMQAITRYNVASQEKIIFRIIKNQKDIRLSYGDLSVNGLGLFLYTKEKILSSITKDIATNYFSPLKNNFQEKLVKGISESLRWPDQGQIFKFKSEAFSSESGKAVKIDYGEQDSEIIRAYKSTAKQELPVITTAVKGIHFYHFSGNHQSDSPEHYFNS